MFSRLAILEIVSEDLLEEDRQSSDPSVVDPFHFVPYQILRSVTEGYHQFAQGRLVKPTQTPTIQLIDKTP
jgi:hypothetical protein